MGEFMKTKFVLVLIGTLVGANLWAAEVIRCTGNGAAAATIVIYGTNVASIELTSGQDEFSSSGCRSIQVIGNKLVSAECAGSWTGGESATATLSSADGILNILQVNLPGQTQPSTLSCSVIHSSNS